MWRAAVLARVARGSLPISTTTRFSILTPYPDLVKTIVDLLLKLCQAGIALNLSHCRGIIIAQLHFEVPHVFEVVAKDGSHFRCTEAWVQKFLSGNLRWTWRRSTQAAQKLPKNVDEVLRENALRLALTFRDGVIYSAAFDVNIDQMMVVYQPGSAATYEVCGSKQVAVVGSEEKRTFTLLLGITASGDLPFQVIYKGKSPQSLPSLTSAGFAEA